MKKLLPFILLLLPPAALAQSAGIFPPDLSVDSSPAADDVFPVWKTSDPKHAKRTSLAALRSGLPCPAGQVLASPALASGPLACRALVSTDLPAGATAYVPLTGASWTPTSGSPSPFTFYSVGSNTSQSPTNQGLRTTTWAGYDTRPAASDGVLMQLSCEQSSHSGTITRSCLGVDIYSEPDNGGDTSGILVRCVGGGPCLTAYKASGMRRPGLTDQSLSPQPAIEVGTSDAGPAIIASAGVGNWGVSKTNEAIEARLGSATSIGHLVWPNDNVYDSRIAYAIGAPQANAQPVNVTYKVLANGDEYHFTGSNSFTTISSALKLSNNTGDGSFQSFTFRKSRSNGPALTSEILGEFGWNLVNSASAEVQGALFRALAPDVVSGTEDVDLHFYQIRAGALTDGIVFRSTGAIEAAASTFTGTASAAKLGAGTGSPDSLIEATQNVTTLPAPLAGAQVHFASADGVGSIAQSDAFGAANTYACRRSNGTNASPTALNLNDVICNIAAYGYGTSFSSTPGASIRLVADQAWTGTAQGGRVDLLTADLNSVTPTTKWSVTAMGHLLSTQTTPPTVACTGTGTSPGAPTVDSGGTDHRWTVTMNTGTGSPGSTGTCTVTLASAFSAARPIVCMLVKGATAWGNGATIQETTESASAPVFTWTNLVGGVATALTVSTSYKFSCLTIG